MTRYLLTGAVLGLLACSSLGVAVPAKVETRAAITDEVFKNLEYFAQYSAASYCQGNNNSTGTKITCSEKNCNRVEAANTKTVAEFQNSVKTDVTGFIAVDTTNKLIVVAFRGSKSLQNWVTDFSFFLTKSTLCKDCEVSTGFWESWGEAEKVVLDAVKKAQAENPGFKVIATGHSLGGALANIAAGVLRNKGVKTDLYTYGAPKIGPKKTAEFLTASKAGSNFRVTHRNDPIPRLPPSFLGFAHIEPEYYISSDNKTPAKITDVSLFNKVDEGNEQDKEFDQEAHREYFGRIGKCEGDDSIKQGELQGIGDFLGSIFS